jgi:hypothetical protein
VRMLDFYGIRLGRSTPAHGLSANLPIREPQQDRCRVKVSVFHE